MEIIGRRIGPYRVLEEIGRGGMGIVFKARHEKLGRLVALKMLVPHLARNPRMRARFLREAKLQAGLTHPNVVNIFDYLEEGENAFLVMEYVPGETLEKMLLKKGRLSVPEVLYVAEGVLEALSFMHRRGVVHRDIKPGNVIVAENGLVKVTDFGIARLAEEEAAITRAGARVGTLYYMAPELLKEGRLSPAADIYSLGVMLFQLLTGRVPFTGRTDYEIIEAHLKKAPPDIRALNPEVPEPLARCIRRALAKKPEERFSSAEEFLSSIREIRDSLTGVASVPKGPGKRIPSLPLGRKHLLAGLVVVGILLLCLIIALRYRDRGERRAVIPAGLPRTTLGGGGAPPQTPVIPLTGSGPSLPAPPILKPRETTPPVRPGTEKPETGPRKVGPGEPGRGKPVGKPPSDAEKSPPRKGGSGWIIRK